MKCFVPYICRPFYLSLTRRQDLTKQYDISFLRRDYKTLSHDYIITRETVTTVMDSNGHTCILKMLFENRTWRWESTIRLMTQAETDNTHAIHISKKDLAIPLAKPTILWALHSAAHTTGMGSFPLSRIDHGWLRASHFHHLLRCTDALYMT